MGWEDELTRGDEVGCGRGCVVREESAVLLVGQAGVVFANVPEEEGREEAGDEVGHNTGVGFVGEETRDGTEDLAEGDLEVRGDFEARGDLEATGDFARFDSVDGKLLEDVLLGSDFAGDVFGRGERGDEETPLDTEPGSDFTFVTGKSCLLFATSLLLVLSFSSFVLFDSNDTVDTLFGRALFSSLTLATGKVLLRSSSGSSFLTFSFIGFLSFNT